MGLKRVFKRFTPHRTAIQNHRHLSLFGELLHDPNIWHITRHSAAGGIANGVFWAFMPIPGQTILSAALAIYFRINLPVSILAVWLTNPVTIYPIYFASYKVGAMILNVPHRNVHFAMTWEWFSNTMIEIWQPLLLGCVILGGLSALVSYYVIRLLWRFAAIRKWQDRKERLRLKKIQQKNSRADG